MAGPGDANVEARRAWNANARFWDERMGVGNDFLDVLVWPAVERLLPGLAGARILDVACGNGVTSRRLAAGGARVLGIDFSHAPIDLARARAGAEGAEIEYRVLDATDGAALASLDEAVFDGALCNMALMDMADLQPLMTALARLLRRGAPFVQGLLAPALQAGFVLDALEERAFPPDHAGGTTPLSWSGRFSEIPPVLVARLRRPVG